MVEYMQPDPGKSERVIIEKQDLAGLPARQAHLPMR